MISVENRVPNPGQEGRVLITPESGSPFYATLAMADGATQPGTPWNRNTGNLLQADIRNYPIAPGQTVTAGQVVNIEGNKVLLSEVPVGSTILLNENGAPVEFIVVHQGLPSSLYDESCNGTWVLRKNVYTQSAWNSKILGNFARNDYASSDLVSAMESMLPLYDGFIQSAIKEVKIPYCAGYENMTVYSGANGYSCHIFPLGVYELGFSTSVSSAMPVDGALLDYFQSGGTPEADALRLAEMDDAAAPYWTRSARTDDTINAWLVESDGSWGYAYVSRTSGVRNAFILDGSALYLENDGSVTDEPSDVFFATTSGTPSQAIALQGGSAGDTIPVIFSGVAQLSGVTQGQQITSPGVNGFGALNGWLSVFPYWTPGVKVATGNYTGTGVSGSSNPNSIIFPFEPKLVFVSNGHITVDDSYLTEWVIWFPGVTTVDANISYPCTFTLSGNTLSWYADATSFPNAQLNTSGKTYYWVAFG